MTKKGNLQGKKKPFTLDEVVKITEVLEKKKNYFELCLFLVGIDTMLRSIDLVSLKVSDVLQSDGRIKEKFIVVPQKTKRKQKRTHPKVLVYLSKTTQEKLTEYVEGAAFNDYLFPSKIKKSCITTRTLRNMVKRWTEKIGLESREYSGHSTRRTMIEHLDKDKNVPIQILQHYLGHASIESTQEYTDNSEERRELIFRRFNMTERKPEKKGVKPEKTGRNGESFVGSPSPLEALTPLNECFEGTISIKRDGIFISIKEPSEIVTV